MGQYYNSVLKDKKGTIKSYYNYGLKLMEHSYFFNNYVNSVCKKLVNKPHYVAWVGDYAEEEDYKDRDNAEMVAELVKNRGKDATQLSSNSAPYGYMGHLLINHSKKQFIDMRDYYNNSILHYGKKKKRRVRYSPIATINRSWKW